MKTLALDTTTEDSEESGDNDTNSDKPSSPNKSNGTSHQNGNSAPVTPVINNSDSINYIVIMNSEAEKHKNKIKKHCNLM